MRRTLFGVVVGVDESGIHRTVIMAPGVASSIDRTAFLAEGVLIRPGDGVVSVGPHSQIGPYSVIFPARDIRIGACVMIGPHAVIAGGNHDFLQTERPMRFGGTLCKGAIIIEDDVWIGAHVCVLDGVRIGRGAVIGAGAVVTHDISPYAVAVGVPARVVRFRVPEAEPALHEEVGTVHGS